jgi:hypothetical protein
MQILYSMFVRFLVMLGREDLHNHGYEDGGYESMVYDSVYLTMAGFDHAKIVIELVHIQLLPE